MLILKKRGDRQLIRYGTLKYSINPVKQLNQENFCGEEIRSNDATLKFRVNQEL